MLIISSTQSTRVATTFYEKSTLTNPYYTWKFVNRNTFNEYWMYAEDFSNNSMYYNYFTISVGNGSPTAGYIDTDNYGEFHYYVYEQSTPYQLTPSSTVVESGILIIEGTSSTINTYTQSDSNTVVVWTNI